jgi:hypothetical protein
MSKPVKIRNVKIKTVDDLKHAKELFRYEAKVNQQAAISGLNHFGEIFRSSARRSVQRYGQKLLVTALLKVLSSRFRR